MKQINEIYFSPCGTTKQVVREIGKAWKEEEKKIWDLSAPDGGNLEAVFPDDEICIVGMPAYGGRVPLAALERMENLRGNHTPAVAVATFGNRAYDDTLAELRDVLTKQGFVVVAAIAAATEHSIMTQFGTGRPDEEDCRELESFAEKIKEKLERGERTAPEVPGNRPYMERHGGGIVPAVTDACKGCGACAAKCPVGAIPAQTPNETDKEKCISCMRCIHICPEKARKIPEPVAEALTARLGKLCADRKENSFYL